MFEEKSWWERASTRKKTALLCGGAALLLLFLMLWILEKPKAGADGVRLPGATIEKQMMDSRPILVLDAGHGGEDPGALNQDGTICESTLTQEMVDRVIALLALHENELRVVQANRTGEYSTPMARADVASKQQADLLVSLHLNADTSPYTKGFQIFPTPPGRVYHDESVRFAELVVKHAGDVGALIMGENGIYYAYYAKIANYGYTKEIIDSQQLDGQPLRDDESFGVVEYAGCPAALVELWHISSPEDMQQFNNEEGKDAMARAVYLAICDYFSLQPLSAGAE